VVVLAHMVLEVVMVQQTLVAVVAEEIAEVRKI
jgi:hypothetical protein